MAFPQVAAAVSSNQVSSQATHPFTLPGGISAGNLLLELMGFDASGGNPVLANFAPFLQFANQANGSSCALKALYRIADGTETSPVAATTGTDEESQHRGLRITGANASAPEVAIATGTSTTPDPPNLSPSWGADDTLWIVACAVDASVNITAYPTNYSSNQSVANSGGTGGVSLAVATRELNAASEDPGTFTLPSSRPWVAFTIAVRPPGAGGGSATTQFAGIVG